MVMCPSALPTRWKQPLPVESRQFVPWPQICSGHPADHIYRVGNSDRRCAPENISEHLGRWVRAGSGPPGAALNEAAGEAEILSVLRRASLRGDAGGQTWGSGCGFGMLSDY